MEKSVEVADIFRAFGPSYRRDHGHNMPRRHLRAMHAIEACRTAELGGHVDRCDTCGGLKISYNSCRNRHCPKCQWLEKERWLDDRRGDLVPTHYFHVVFTLPQKMRPWALKNQQLVYALLFRAASQTLATLARDPRYLGAQIGCLAVLHTWTQTLIDHPHLHCIVTAGGLAEDGNQWITWRKGLFIPVKVLSLLFRGIFLEELKRQHAGGRLKAPRATDESQPHAAFDGLIAALYRQPWVVYCKPVLAAPEHVIAYLGRYTHRVALSNDRLVRLENGQVTFRWRDSARHNKTKLMTVEATEIIRRFLLHVLPSGFVKIRYYGILSHRNRATKLLTSRLLLGAPVPEVPDKVTWQDLFQRLTGIDPRACPFCNRGRMVQTAALLPLVRRSQPLGMPP
jgi:hypothetical protein